SLSASCNRVCIEIAMERSRQGVTILPLSGLQQSACDQGLHLTSAQLNLDAHKPASATVAIPAHPSGPGRDDRHALGRSGHSWSPKSDGSSPSMTVLRSSCSLL